MAEHDAFQRPEEADFNGVWQPVAVTVEAKVGPVDLRLFPATDDEAMRPWAWGAMCVVTFRFDGRWTTRKRLRERFAWTDELGYPKDRPSDNDLRRGRETVLTNIRGAIAAHGVAVRDLVVKEMADV